MADLLQKEMIFGLLEVMFAFTTVFTLSAAGLATQKWGTDFSCLFGCTGALIPLMMRFSMRFFNGSDLPKIGEIMVLIWAMVLYFIGGIMLIIIRQDGSYAVGDNHYVPAAFALIVAIICTIDLILALCGK